MSIDGGEVGRYEGAAPLEVPGLPPGPHDIKIYFDSGGHYSQEAYVVAGQTIDVHVEMSVNRQKFAYRKGLNFGAYGGPSIFYLADEAGGGIRLGFAANYGIVPGIDFRTGVDAVLGGLEERFAVMAALPVKLHFNLGSVYTMMIGGYIGLHSIEREFRLFKYVDSTPTYEYTVVRTTNVWFGPTASVLTFRFGSRRQFELGVDNTLVVGVFPRIEHGSGFDETVGEELHPLNLRVDTAFTWMFLPDE